LSKNYFEEYLVVGHRFLQLSTKIYKVDLFLKVSQVCYKKIKESKRFDLNIFFTSRKLLQKYIFMDK